MPKNNNVKELLTVASITNVHRIVISSNLINIHVSETEL